MAAKAGTEVANTVKDVAQMGGDIVDWGKNIWNGSSSQSSDNASSNNYGQEQTQVHQRQERYEQGYQQVWHQQVQQSHQAHGGGAVKPAKFEVGNTGNMESRMDGQVIRNHEGAMAPNSTAIDAKTTQVQSQGNEVVINSQNNQSKVVNRQVDPKGVKEIGNIAKDTSNIKFGEKQQQ